MARKIISDNPRIILKLLLKRLRYPYSNELYELMEHHPDFPSFLSFHYLLKRIGVDSVALKATYDDLQHKLPKPAVVHATTNVELFLLVDSVDDSNVYVAEASNQITPIEKGDFLKMWQGNVLIVDSENVPLKKLTIHQKLKNLLAVTQKPFVLASLLALFTFLLLFHICERDVLNAAYLVLYAFGIVFSVLLLIDFFDKHNPVVKKMCSSKSGGNKVSCSNILDSKEAYFLGLFSWSDIGFVFMATLFAISLLLPVKFANALACFSSIPAFGYVFYSIYYQWIIAKSWCRLCLGVQVVLACLFVVSFSAIKFVDLTLLLDVNLLGLAVLVAISIAALYVLLKPLIYRSIQFSTVEKQYQGLKHSPDVQEVLLQSQPIILSQEVPKIVLGNVESSSTLTVVFSPICNPCLNELKKLFDYFASKEDFKLEIIFLIDKVAHPESYAIALTLLKQYRDEPTKIGEKLKQYVFNYPISANEMSISPNNNEELQKIILAQKDWCKEQKIASTPVLIFNNRLLPASYSIEDIDFMCF